MDNDALSQSQSKDGLAKEDNGLRFTFEDHQNDSIPSHLLPPNHPIHIKGPPKFTIAAIRTPSSSGEVDLEDEKAGAVSGKTEPEVPAGEECGKPKVGDDEERQQEDDTPTKVSHGDHDVSTSNAPTKKWYLRPGCLALFALAACVVIAAIAIPVILTSQNGEETTAPAPTSAPTISPTQIEQLEQMEQIACNFILRTNLPDCRSTLRVDGSAQLTAIPSEIGLLTQLRSLALDISQLTGTIPLSLSNLTRLTYLSLQYCQLNGTIPSLSSLSQLTGLDLGNNYLTGSIPPLSNLLKLESLSLGGNKLLTGTIPSLSKLSELTSLSLSDNILTGSIPSLAQLSQLTLLELEINKLIGTIPSLSNLSSLTSLDLSSNRLTGSIPSLSNLLKMDSLFLSDNRLTGTIPSLPNSTYLVRLEIQDNNLNGSISSSLCSVGVNTYYVDCNDITCPPGCCEDGLGNSCG